MSNPIWKKLYVCVYTITVTTLLYTITITILHHDMVSHWLAPLHSAKLHRENPFLGAQTDGASYCKHALWNSIRLLRSGKTIIPKRSKLDIWNLLYGPYTKICICVNYCTKSVHRKCVCVYVCEYGSFKAQCARRSEICFKPPYRIIVDL